MESFSRYSGIFYYSSDVTVVSVLPLHNGDLTLTFNERSVKFEHDGADILTGNYNEPLLLIKVSQRHGSHYVISSNDWSIELLSFRRSKRISNIKRFTM